MPSTGGFWSVPIQVDHNRILSVPDDYRFADLIWAGIDFLMRYVRRNVNEIARASFPTHFELIAPSHSNCASYHVQHRLQFAVVMRSGFGIGLNNHGAGPQLVRSGSRMRDCGTASHARCLRCVQIEFI